MNEYGLVSIAGAGPGNPELITNRAKRRLQRADVVFHDKLSPNSLIERYCHPEIDVHDVGKRKGKVGPDQQQINHRLVEAARDHDYVVRLKGGDPFLFGRGGEETAYLAEQGVPFEVVPGISSILGATAYAGIPLTHREHSSSLGVVTGHGDPNRPDSSPDWEQLAELETLVVMMGITRAEQIAERLIRAGKSASTPVAMIGWGTRAVQKVWTSTLEGLKEGPRDRSKFLPGLIVIGEVVDCREQIDWTENLPLFGQQIVVTRPETTANKLSDTLRDLGAEVMNHPTIRIRPLEEGLAQLQALVPEFDSYDGIALTSRNGVRMVREVIGNSSRDVRCLSGLSIACIGPGTAGEFSEWGIEADLVPETYRAEQLAERIMEEYEPGSWLIPRARGGRDVLPEKLRASGFEVDEIHTYVSEPNEDELARIETSFNNEFPTMITFTSSSTVDSLFTMVGQERATSWLRDMASVAIGPITAGTLEEYGITADVVAEKHDIPGLIEAIRAYYRSETPGEWELTGS